MAQQLYFSRDSKMFIEFKGYVWEVPVLDGFSFSQSTNSSEITLAEMESSTGASRRGRKAFNDSLSPGEWSCSTYVRPFKAAGASTPGSADLSAKVHAVEELLWALMMGADDYTNDLSTNGVSFFENSTAIPIADTVQGETYEIVAVGTTANWTDIGASAATTGIIFTKTATAVVNTAADATCKRIVNKPTTTESRFSFHASNSSTFEPANLYFVIGDSDRKVMKLKDITVNEATLDFDIDGIATINWSGNSNDVIDFGANTYTAAAIESTGKAIGDVLLDSSENFRLYVHTAEGAVTPYINEAIDSTDNFIRNRLTQLTITTTANTVNSSSVVTAYGTADPDKDGTEELETSYDLTLTGGSISISNNVTYITPEVLGTVNVPIGHVTGTRTVSGSFTCYLTSDSNSDKDSSAFYDDLRSITNVVTNSLNLTFKVGGTTSTAPRLEVNMPNCHIEIPTHSIEDVISLESNFSALPSTIDNTDEVTVKYLAS
jgi:hypothetical protein